MTKIKIKIEAKGVCDLQFAKKFEASIPSKVSPQFSRASMIIKCKSWKNKVLNQILNKFKNICVTKFMSPNMKICSILS